MKMKSLLAIFAILFAFAICGCGDDFGDGGEPNPNPTPTSEVDYQLRQVATGRANVTDVCTDPQGYIYWTENSGQDGGLFRVHRNALGDTAPTPENCIVANTAQPSSNIYSLCYVPDALGGNGYIYYTCKSGQNGKVMRVVIPDGGADFQKPEAIATGLQNPAIIRYNEDNGFVYWTQFSNVEGFVCRVYGQIAYAADVPSGADSFKMHDTTLMYPYAFTFQGDDVLVAELAGPQSKILLVKERAQNDLNPNVYVIMENTNNHLTYPTSIVEQGGVIYYANYMSGTGVYAIAHNGNEYVEQGQVYQSDNIGQIFSINLYANYLIMSRNIGSAQGGNILSVLFGDANAISLAPTNQEFPAFVHINPYAPIPDGNVEIFWTNNARFDTTTADFTAGTSSLYKITVQEENL